MGLVAVIPTLGRSGLLPDLVEHLQGDGVVNSVWVLDNGAKDEGADRVTEAIGHPKVRLFDSKGMSIYEMWNSAASMAHGQFDHIAVLNDDVRLVEGALGALVAGMTERTAVISHDPWMQGATVRHPLKYQRVSSTAKDGGLTGWAFVAKTDCWPWIDETFEWWCGDDDMVKQAYVNGHEVAVLRGLGCGHINEATARTESWTHGAKTRDVQRFRDKYGTW